jgi:hypothetical protein
MPTVARVSPQAATPSHSWLSRQPQGQAVQRWRLPRARPCQQPRRSMTAAAARTRTGSAPDRRWAMGTPRWLVRLPRRHWTAHRNRMMSWRGGVRGHLAALLRAVEGPKARPCSSSSRRSTWRRSRACTSGLKETRGEARRPAAAACSAVAAPGCWPARLGARGRSSGPRRAPFAAASPLQTREWPPLILCRLIREQLPCMRACPLQLGFSRRWFPVPRRYRGPDAAQLFWFGRPRVLLRIVQLIYYENSLSGEGRALAGCFPAAVGGPSCTRRPASPYFCLPRARASPPPPPGATLAAHHHPHILAAPFPPQWPPSCSACGRMWSWTGGGTAPGPSWWS